MEKQGAEEIVAGELLRLTSTACPRIIEEEEEEGADLRRFSTPGGVAQMVRATDS